MVDTRYNKQFPGLGVSPSPTNTIVGIGVGETWLQPNLAGRLSADVGSKWKDVFEIDFAIFSLNSQIQTKTHNLSQMVAQIVLIK